MIRLPKLAPKRVFTLSLSALATLFTISLSALNTAQASAPTVLNHTKSAVTGDIIFLQGDNFGATPTVRYSDNSPFWKPITPLTRGNNALTARIPFPSGKTGQSIRTLITLQVYNGSAWSSTVFVNQAHAMSYDTPEVAASSPFRIFGRDLYYAQTPAVTPTVRFVDQTTNASLSATVTTSGSNAYVLNVTAPAGLVAGDTYDVYVSNGYTGSNTLVPGAAETKSDEPLLARSYGTGASDVWQLGVPWGAAFSATSSNVYNVKTDPRLTLHAAGDGTTDDEPAIQAALNAAYYAGGGVVYLPAGTYTLQGDVHSFPYDGGRSLEILSHVVMQGAGVGQTTVEYGFPNTYGTGGVTAPFPGISWGDSNNPYTDVGVADMTIQNVDTAGKWNPPGNSQNNLVLSAYPENHSGQGLSEIFMQRVKVIANAGAVMSMGGITKLAVENCDFELLGGYTDTWLGAGSNSIFRNNIVHWSGGGAVSFSNTPDILVENNHFIRNCNYALYPQVANTRCFDTASNKNLIIQNNLFDVEGGIVNTQYNDGETISSEPSNAAVDQDTGSVTSATATTLTDTTKNWTVPVDYRHLTTCFSNIAVVAIVGGKGTGEWQMIVPSTSANTLTVPSPWTIPLDTTSKYTVTDWENENWLVAGNTLNNGRIGIQLYFGSSHDTAIVSNTLTDNGGITILPFENENPASPKMFTPTWDDQMIGNTVTDTKGGYYQDPNTPSYWDGSGPAQIGEQSGSFNTSTNLGTSVIGLEVRGNTLNGSGTKFKNYGYESEGYCSYFTYGSNNQTNFADTYVPALLGTIFQGNTANNCNTGTATSPPNYVSNGAFRISSGAYQTVLQDNIVNVAGSLLEDDLTLYDNTPNRSVGTYGSSAGKGNNWLDVDIGSPGLAGSATLSNGVFTISGAGNGIQTGASADQINYCYQTLAGSGTIIARVTGQPITSHDNTSIYAAAGVIIRHIVTDPITSYFVTDLYENYPSPGSAIVLSGGRFVDDGTGGNTTISGAVPYWVKVVRSGTTFTGSAAPDLSGAPGTWVVMSTQTIAGSSGWSMDIGLMTQAGTNSTLSAATIDHVSVTSP